MPGFSPIASALIGTGITFCATALGAALVFFFKKDINPKFQRVFMGFAAGIMIAAAVWSLLIPSMETAAEQGMLPVLPVAGGFVLGVLFLMLLDLFLPHMHAASGEIEGLPSSMRKTTMLVLAVTLHNIPEGIAVGLSFALAASQNSTVTYAGAIALAIGMALQNFPEGAAISLPLKKEGLSSKKAFFYGSLSGLVEPIAGVIGVLLAGSVVRLMPWALSFAAGAMIFVVVEELIPDSQEGHHSHAGTLGVVAGFLLMMVLDMMLS